MCPVDSSSTAVVRRAPGRRTTSGASKRRQDAGAEPRAQQREHGECDAERDGHRDQRAVPPRHALTHQERGAGDQSERRGERDTGPRSAEQHGERRAEERVPDGAQDAAVRRRHVDECARSARPSTGGPARRCARHPPSSALRRSATAAAVRLRLRHGAGAMLTAPPGRDQECVREDEHFALGQAVDTRDVVRARPGWSRRSIPPGSSRCRPASAAASAEDASGASVGRHRHGAGDDARPAR